MDVLVGVVVDGPRGPVWIAAGATGVVAVEQLGTLEGFLAGLARRGFGEPRMVAAGSRAGDPAAALALETAQGIAAFLEGEDVPLETLPVDLGDRPAWDRLVLEGVRAIPRGAVAAYGEVAARIGRPGAARAVGGAVGRNPVGLLIPCHRVIAAGGALGGYGAAAWGGIEAALELKSFLLELEGTEVIRGRVHPCGHGAGRDDRIQGVAQGRTPS